MPDPINYLGLQQTQSPMESLLNGLKVGSALSQARQESQAADLAKQYGQDVQAALSSGKASDFAALSAKYPQQREAFKQSYDMLHKAQQDSEFGAGVQVFNALSNGNPDAANAVLDQHIAALENSGQDASDLKGIKSQIASNPNAAKGVIGLYLSSVDPDRWSKIATEQRASEAAPYELTEKQAKAQKAAVDAKFADSSAALDLQKKGWDIQKIQSDMQVAKLNSQIAAMNAQASREQNDLKRQELQQKLQDKQIERDAAVRDKTNSVESGRAAIDNFLNTADSVLKTPAGVVSSAAGTISSRLPTVDQDVADFEESLKQLGSQAFLSQVPAMKGLGALTEAEGKKLESSLANLSLRQSPEKLLSNVKEAQRLMLKARTTLADRYGVPDTIPDRPNAATTAPGMPQGFKVLGVEGQ